MILYISNVKSQNDTIIINDTNLIKITKNRAVYQPYINRYV